VAENWAFTAAAFRSSSPVPEAISPWRNELTGGLPLGAQRQVAFAVALSHQPELLILDEPTSGMGPLGRARLWEKIRDAADQGDGVLVTTHNMEEAEQCDRLVIMADGRVVARGTAAQIIGDHKAVEVRCADLNRAFALLDSNGYAVTGHGEALRVSGETAGLAELLAREGLDATVEVVPASLEEAFVAIVSGPAAT